MVAKEGLLYLFIVTCYEQRIVVLIHFSNLLVTEHPIILSFYTYVQRLKNLQNKSHKGYPRNRPWRSIGL
jgi:hypothetical protein